MFIILAVVCSVVELDSITLRAISNVLPIPFTNMRGHKNKINIKTALDCRGIGVQVCWSHWFSYSPVKPISDNVLFVVSELGFVPKC